jgi:hypothetical protein
MIKMITFSALPTIKMYIQGLPEGGCAPLCFGDLKWAAAPLIAKKMLDM